MSGPIRVRRRRLETPLGPMVALSAGASLIALEFERPERDERLQARLARWLPPHVVEDGDAPVLAGAAAWLAEYFAGREADPRRVAIDMHGTPFERAVWQRLLDIPAGATRSYGVIAAGLGLRNGARAVGLANGANPLAIFVPCHRVIGADGALVGYGGGLDRKRWLLEHERRWSLAPALF